MSLSDDGAVFETPEQRRLQDSMGRVESFLADLETREEADPDTAEPDAETQAALRGLCSTDDAPLEWRSILHRVEQGTQTWKRVWDQPRLEEGAAGVRLKTTAMTLMARASLATLGEAEEALLQQADEINRRRMGR